MRKMLYDESAKTSLTPVAVGALTWEDGGRPLPLRFGNSPRPHGKVSALEREGSKIYGEIQLFKDSTLEWIFEEENEGFYEFGFSLSPFEMAGDCVIYGLIRDVGIYLLPANPTSLLGRDDD